MLIKTNSKMSTSNNDNVKNTPFIDGFCKCRLQSLMLILFITLMNHTTSWAQPGKSGDAGQQSGGANFIAPRVESIEQTPKEKALNKERTAPIEKNNKPEIPSNNKIWANYLDMLNNDKSFQFKVNRDSIYNAYKINRYFVADDDAESFMVKIIPNESLKPILERDTALFKYVRIQNALFATITSNNARMLQRIKPYFELINYHSQSFSISTSNMLTYVLPKVVVGQTPINIAYYKQIIEQYLSNNPEVLLYCSDDFIKIITLNRYTLLYNLHCETSNIIRL